MLEDTMGDAFEEEELEEDIQNEVDKVLNELTADKLKAAPKLPEAPADVEEEEEEEAVVEDEKEEEIEEMQSRLQALRS
jgi:charged multivesicular body protein 3